MERKEYEPKSSEPIDPSVIAIIVRWQIEEIMKKSERAEFIDNMNA